MSEPLPACRLSVFPWIHCSIPEQRTGLMVHWVSGVEHIGTYPAIRPDRIARRSAIGPELDATQERSHRIQCVLAYPGERQLDF